MNVICNAAAQGVAIKGMCLIVTGEPCLMCAKLIVQCGISHVICVKGGYLGGGSGPRWLENNDVTVEWVKGPQDPRATAERGSNG